MIKNCRIVDDSGRILEPYQVFWRFQDLIPESKYDVTLQFGSGLFDKHGEELFEGDTVKHDYGWTKEVEFKNGAFMLGDFPLHAYTDANDIEKIG
jgi:hypothetical protein